MTRAQKKLHITHAEYRRLFNQESYQRPSRFLAEIPAEYCTYTNNNASYHTSATTPRLFDAPQSTQSEQSWRLGTHVRHAKFGEGIVLNAEGQGKASRIQVKFGQHGTKWLLTDYAKLEIL